MGKDTDSTICKELTFNAANGLAIGNMTVAT